MLVVWEELLWNSEKGKQKLTWVSQNLAYRSVCTQIQTSGRKQGCREQAASGINCCVGLGAIDMALLFLLIHLPSFTVFIITTVLVFLFISESKMTEPLDAFVCETLLSAVFVSPLPSQLWKITLLMLQCLFLWPGVIPCRLVGNAHITIIRHIFMQLVCSRIVLRYSHTCKKIK